MAMLFLISLFVLCIFNIAVGADGAESSPSITHEPVRTEARHVDSVESIGIANNSIEHKTLPLGGYPSNIRFSQMVVFSTVMRPVRRDDELCKTFGFFIVRSGIWDWVGSDNSGNPQLCQEGGALPDIFNRPVEPDRVGWNANRWPSFGVAWSDHNPGSALILRYVEGLSESPPLAERDERIDNCGESGGDPYVDCRPRGRWWPHPIIFAILGLVAALVCAFGGLFCFLGSRRAPERWLRWIVGAGLFLLFAFFVCIQAIVGVMGYWWVR